MPSWRSVSTVVPPPWTKRWSRSLLVAAAIALVGFVIGAYGTFTDRPVVQLVGALVGVAGLGSRYPLERAARRRLVGRRSLIDP